MAASMKLRHTKLREALEAIVDPPPPRCVKRFDAASGRLWCGACCAHDDDPRYGKDCQPRKPKDVALEALQRDDEADTR